MNRNAHRLIRIAPHTVGMPLPKNADSVCVNLKQRILVDRPAFRDEAKLYRVQSIPATYLLDANLKIVAKNLRGEVLEKKLEELLGEGDIAASDAVDQPGQEGDE